MTQPEARGRRRSTSLLLVLALLGLTWQAASAQRRGEIEFQAEMPAQQEAVERALADLKPSQAGQGRLFFVGFAGYGYEAVFKREVVAVRKLFDERFGTGGRSVALINHATTRTRRRWRRATNLEQVLTRRRPRDGQGAAIRCSCSSPRTATAACWWWRCRSCGWSTSRRGCLKAMLARSGIRNRVIVMSACHSGSFIPALADAAHAGDRGGARGPLLLWLQRQARVDLFRRGLLQPGAAPGDLVQARLQAGEAT